MSVNIPIIILARPYSLFIVYRQKHFWNSPSRYICREFGEEMFSHTRTFVWQCYWLDYTFNVMLILGFQDFHPYDHSETGLWLCCVGKHSLYTYNTTHNNTIMISVGDKITLDLTPPQSLPLSSLSLSLRHTHTHTSYTLICVLGISSKALWGLHAQFQAHSWKRVQMQAHMYAYTPQF